MSKEFAQFPSVETIETGDLLLISRLDVTSPSGRSNYTIDVGDLVNMAASEATQVDVVSDTVTYIGKAEAGSATSAGAWKIQKMTTNAAGDVSIQWADGNTLYDNIWDNRLSLSYS